MKKLRLWSDRPSRIDGRIAINGCKNPVALNLHTLESEAVSYKDGVAEISLEPAESVVLVETEDEAPVGAVTRGKPICLKGAVFTRKATIQNMITLDSAIFSEDGGQTSWPEFPVMAIKDMLLRRKFAGRGMLTYSFVIETVPSTLKAVWEPLKGMQVAVNGTAVEPSGDWWLGRTFCSAEISYCLKKGKNELTISFDYFQRDYVYHVLYDDVSESLRNCLWFDTEIECVMLVGDFAVDFDRDKLVSAKNHAEIYNGTEFVLTEQKEILDLHDLVRDGYPFFGGEICAETSLTWHEGDPDELALPGRYAVVRGCVNQEKVGTLLFTDHVSLKVYLKDGENRLTLTLINSNRNLLGPHHCPDPEPMAVGPTTFSCENTFDSEGRSSHYIADRYAFVHFSIDY